MAVGDMVYIAVDVLCLQQRPQHGDRAETGDL